MFACFSSFFPFFCCLNLNLTLTQTLSSALSFVCSFILFRTFRLSLSYLELKAFSRARKACYRWIVSLKIGDQAKERKTEKHMLFKGPWIRFHEAIPYQTVDISFLSTTRSYFFVFVCSVTLCFFHIPTIHLVQIRQPWILFEHIQSPVYFTGIS